ncbi:MAG: hypothetical protein ACP5O7_00005 [Phycisphaerae bacterium]
MATIALLLLLAACSHQQPVAKSPAAPVVKLARILINRTRRDATRLSADRTLRQSIGVAAPLRLAALTFIIESPGQHAAMRIYAIQQLFRANPPLAQQVLTHTIPHLEQWPVITCAASFAARLHTPALTAALAQSLARPSTTHKLTARPEALALQHIYHAPLPTALQMLITSSAPIAGRIEALRTLLAIQGQSTVVHWLRSQATPARQTDALMLALRWWALRFNYAPVAVTQVLWIQEFYETAFTAGSARPPGMRPAKSILQKATQRFTWMHQQHLLHRLPPEQVCLLACAPRSWLTKPRPFILHWIHHDLRQRQHLARPGVAPSLPPPVPVTLSANAAKMHRLDDLLLVMLLRSLHNHAFRAAIFHAGANSRSNQHSETGGLIIPLTSLTISSRTTPAHNLSQQAWPNLLLRNYPPQFSINNRIYVTSNKLLADTSLGLTQYIFHFQRVHNQRYVGPAAGDLRFAAYNQCYVVIFTSIGKHKFDATLDTPSGAVIDLGIYPAA